MITLEGARILVLAPHTDDGELAAGGSIAKWCALGNDVHYLAFSACETIQPPELDPNILRQECAASTATLGIPSSNLSVLDYEVRHFDRQRQSILDTLVAQERELKPDLVLVPSLDDTHQDHAIVAGEARRAFKKTRMLGYEVPWNNFRFETTCFVRLESTHVETKIRALAYYRSQADRAYMTPEYLRSQVTFHGAQAASHAAEAFQVLRWFL